MSTIRRLQILFLILMLAHYTAASDLQSKGSGDETGPRGRRHIRKSENVSESVKKQKQQEQSDSLGEVSGSQLTRSASYDMNTGGGGTEKQINMDQSMHNSLPNSPSQARQMSFPFNAGGLPNFNNLYQNYVPPDVFNGFASATRPFEQIYNNFGAQLPFWNYYNNPPSFQSFVPGGFVPQEISQIWQPGLAQLDQFTQQNFPPPFANNFINYLPQPGLQQSLRSNDEQLGRPIAALQEQMQTTL